MDPLEETKLSYDTHATEYEKRTKDYIEEYIQKDFNLYLQNLKGRRILDIGSGPGRDSIRFKQRGFHPVCIDISKTMIELCKNKGLEAYEMNMENLDFDNNSFDGVWAYTSLLHLPKSRIKNAIKEIKRVLKPGGILYLGMKEGNSEGFEKREHYPNHKRYFALYPKEEIEKLISGFEIIHFSETKIDKEHTYLNFLCKKS
ncbi:hypothetical protein B6U91_01990 [Candidatus Pacearchaeota archaeon ex4484_71]|nr:MAG: hypothetical protein B6U91_01990 [Candidatus Pacearchaeota archaeon ex4484_71]